MNHMDDITLHPVILEVPENGRILSRPAKVAALRHYARLALALSARQSGVILAELHKDDLGAPLPQKGIYWSISHKEFFVAAVAAPHPVGIDIEMIKPIRDGLHERIADGEEWALLAPDRELAFFRIWTAKEAVLKAVGKGMTALAACRVTAVHDDRRMDLSMAGTLWYVIHQRVDRQHLAALTTRGERIQWHQIAANQQATDYSGLLVPAPVGKSRDGTTNGTASISEYAIARKG